jgi:hypothetical protein
MQPNSPKTATIYYLFNFFKSPKKKDELKESGSPIRNHSLPQHDEIMRCILPSIDCAHIYLGGQDTINCGTSMKRALGPWGHVI